MKTINNINTASVVPASKPVKNRFKPGQSGNPSGRPKGSFNFKKQLSLMTSDRATLSCEYGDIPLSPRFVSVFKAVDAAMHNKLDKLQNLLPNLDITIKTTKGVNDD